MRGDPTCKWCKGKGEYETLYDTDLVPCFHSSVDSVERLTRRLLVKAAEEDGGIDAALLATPLPCDISVGSMVFSKGLSLRVLVHAAARWKAEAVVGQQTLREAWIALRMIREALETLGQPGTVRAEEALDGPTLLQEADALVAGIGRLVKGERDWCARIAREGCLVPPDGGSPTPEEIELCDRISERILAQR